MTTHTWSVLVNGGSRGLGRALTLHLARQGYRVTFTGRNQATLDELAAELPEQCLGVVADSVNETDTAAAIRASVSAFGPLDVLINNAGTAGPGGLTWDTSATDWWRVQEVNLKGPMLYTRGVLPQMIRAGKGTIINIGSYAAIRPTPGNSAYSVSKAALARFSDSLAAELEDTGIQIYCVSPGLVLTDMTRGLPAFKDVPPEHWNKPGDICTLVDTLLQRDCSVLSGRFLHVNDDIDELLARTGEIEEQELYQLQLKGLE